MHPNTSISFFKALFFGKASFKYVLTLTVFDVFQWRNHPKYLEIVVATSAGAMGSDSSSAGQIQCREMKFSLHDGFQNGKGS